MWPEIWNIIGPMLEGVLARGEATWSENTMLPLRRHGFSEECYFTFSYSPIRDESGGIGGIFTAVTETTLQVLSERRLHTLQQVSTQAREAKTDVEVCTRALTALAGNHDDVPFAQLHLLDRSRATVRLVAAIGPTAFTVGAGAPPLPIGDARWPFAAMLADPDGPRLVALDEDATAVDGIVAVVYDVTELTDARRAAEGANRARDEFLAMLGHELRNPLAPILTSVQLMRLRAGDLLRKERTVIERQAKHLVRLVDDLLDVSRFARGKVELQRERVELAEVVAKAIELASPLLEEKRHSLEARVPPTGLAVDGDPTRLAQVISNLLTNAAKYTEPGGRITVSTTATREKVSLRVRDTGIGIGPEMLPRIFDLFVQERQSLDRSRGGLGLGLAIVQTLVTLHGGTVEAHSAGIGLGSEFVVHLPRAQSQAPALNAADPEPEPAPVPGQRPQVLVVDDNEDAGDSLADYLECSGYSVQVARDGASALLLVGGARPDVALLDIGLPGMSGYELAKRLRELAGPRLRLVAVTGYGQESDVLKARQAGFDAHLVKPVNLDSLESMLVNLSPGDRHAH